MKIGIDAREINKPETGTGMYVVNLIKYIAKIDKGNTYTLFVYNNYRIDEQLPDNFDYYDISDSLFSKFDDQIKIPYAIWRSKIDIFHVTHHDVIPLFTFIPLIVTVLDIAWIDMPGSSSKLFQYYYFCLTKLAVIKAKKIITISNSTKTRIEFYFPYIQNKTYAVPISCNNKYSPIRNDSIYETLKKEFNINEPYVLYVGSFATRKNIKLLMDSMMIIWKENPKIQLVLAGKPSGKDDYSIEDASKSFPIIVISRNKSIEELQNLYINASVFVFPSLYEGFGLPVLEALSCGCPVIGINTTSIPEIIGDAGVLLNENDVEGMAKNINLYIKNKDIKVQVSNKCIHQASKFNWNTVAINTISCYYN